MNGNRRGLILSVAMLAWLTASGRAATEKEIDQAVERGVKYLKSIQQKETGDWKYAESGATSLVALTLLVCDVPNNDPAITKAADFVRAAVPKMTHTYSIAMAIVFFDRLGDPADIPLIESLMVRLIAGQSGDGGWGYQCPGLANAEVQRLTGMIGKRTELKGGRFPRPGEKKQPSELQKETIQQLQQLGRGGVAPGGAPGGAPGVPPPPMAAGSDNSNTQFATLAMWVGRKHGLPVDGSLVKLDARFRNSQGDNGGWGYINIPGAGAPVVGFEPNAQMTCAGIMGIAIYHGIANDPQIKRGGPGSDPKADPSLVKAVNFLAASVPQGDVKPAPLGHGQGKVYYSMWSMERACMALGLTKLGKTDWHQWGADLLLVNQAPDGGWHGEYSNDGGGAYGADTCFALLFLRKANFTGDLSTYLRGKFVAELRGVTRLPGVKGLTTPAEKQGEDPRGKEKDQPKAKPIETREKTTSEKLSDALVMAKGEERKTLLKDYEKGNGRDYTVALALSIPLLDGEDKASARDVLQERLAGLSVTNLEYYTTKEEDAEIRAAAILASARKPKDDRSTLVPLIIDRLADREPYVVRAAAFALKFISREDFGPTETATAKEIEAAMEKWKDWWMKNKG